MPSIPSVVPAASWLVLLVGLAVTPAMPTLSLAAETNAATMPKDHVLFMGLNVAIPVFGGSGSVVSVSKGSAQIEVRGEIQTLAIRELSDVKTSRTPKVSGTVLTLSEPAGVRTYSPSSSPGREILVQQMDLAFIQDMRMTQVEGLQKRGLVGSVQGASGEFGPNRDSDALQASRESNANQAAAIEGSIRGEASSLGGVANWASSSDNMGLYDAYAVTFTIASPEPFENAFAVLIMEVRAADTPNEPLQTIMFRNLPQLSPEPRKITLEQRGLPQGFAVDRVAIHVYAQGRELATNLSPQQVAVTRDEAHQFLLIRYVLEHKHANLPATPVPDLLSAGVRDLVPAPELGRTIEVHVNGDGRVEQVKLDPTLDGSKASYVESLVRETRFFPALVDGEPTAGDTTFTLAELAR